MSSKSAASKSHRLLGCSLAALLAAGHASAAHANEDVAAAGEAASADAGDSGSTIVVTAQRREERLQDVPVAVTAIGEEKFTVGGLGRSANEVLNLVPNASAGTQQHGRPRWWIRGVGAGQSASIRWQFPVPNNFSFGPPRKRGTTYLNQISR